MRAVLYQDDRRVLEVDLADRRALAQLLQQYLSHHSHDSAAFNHAGAQFRADLPDMALDLKRVIEQERGRNPAFAAAFEEFHRLCRGSINPNIGFEEIKEMLVQHLLTERSTRRVAAGVRPAHHPRL